MADVFGWRLSGLDILLQKLTCGTVGFFGYVPSLSSSLGLSGLPIGSSLSGRSIRGLSRGDLLLSPLSFLGFAPFGAVG